MGIDGAAEAVFRPFVHATNSFFSAVVARFHSRLSASTRVGRCINPAKAAACLTLLNFPARKSANIGEKSRFSRSL
jgi:hypothetical protein